MSGHIVRVERSEAVENALGEWSFLAAFPFGFRERLSNSLGTSPTLARYYQVWELCGSDSMLAHMRYTRVDGTNACVVASEAGWPKGADVDGTLLELFLGEHEGVILGFDGIHESYDYRGIEGWCYKSLSTGDVGACEKPWPTVRELKSLGVQVGELEQVAERVSSGVLHVPAGQSSEVLAAGAGGQSAVGVQDDDVVGGRDVGGTTVLAQLKREVDFTECFCRVHAAPRVDIGGQSLGCCAKKVGTAGVISAAAEGRYRMCHAEPGVRQLDRQFLELVEEVELARQRGLPPVLPDVSGFRSSSPTTSADFGRGYCYLDPVDPYLRWRVARLLGPNPLCSDVLLVWRLSLAIEFKPKVILRVADGWYHVAPDKSFKGKSAVAGHLLCEELSRVVSEHSDSRVGAQPDKPAKQFCTECEFMVVMEGHEERCRPQPVREVKWNGVVRSDLSSSDIRRLAWVGDAMHKLDLRLLLMATGAEDGQLQIEAAKYEERQAQAEWYDKYEGEKFDSASTGVKSRSTAFEASYYGVFRREYVSYLGKQFGLDESYALLCAALASPFVKLGE